MEFLKDLRYLILLTLLVCPRLSLAATNQVPLFQNITMPCSKAENCYINLGFLDANNLPEYQQDLLAGALEGFSILLADKLWAQLLDWPISGTLSLALTNKLQARPTLLKQVTSSIIASALLSCLPVAKSPGLFLTCIVVTTTGRVGIETDIELTKQQWCQDNANCLWTLNLLKDFLNGVLTGGVAAQAHLIATEAGVIVQVEPPQQLINPWQAALASGCGFLTTAYLLQILPWDRDTWLDLMVLLVVLRRLR